jgi:uncharacterized zinc-type alcohol dehydrogenase-like protein
LPSITRKSGFFLPPPRPVKVAVRVVRWCLAWFQPVAEFRRGCYNKGWAETGKHPGAARFRHVLFGKELLMTKVSAFAALQAGGDFQPFEYELPELDPQQVEIEVESCGICHSDLSMRDNDWEMTEYPFVGGHEVIGRVAEIGDQVPGLQVGDRVGLGWFSRSCMHCDQCLDGNQNLCAEAEGTITHQMGGFADRVRCHWGWAVPIPDALPAGKCGPLLCGGITVFHPIVQHAVSPTARVGVVGIGGLGHMAVKFLKAWGCEVTAFSRTRAKEAAARDFGAHEFVATSEPGALESVAGKFDLILNTTNVELPWDAYVAALAPRGVLHTVGAAPKVEAAVFPMIVGQKSLSSSPLGGIATTRRMLDFCARHDITPEVETFPMQDINDAFERLRQAPSLRLVLTR